MTVRHGDTHGAPQGIGTFGSRSTALGGSALVLAARDVREKARALAAGLLEAAPQDVVAVNGGFGVVGAPGRRVTWARVAEFAYRGQGLPAGTEPGLEATRFFSAEGEVWSAGAFVVSVRIDPEAAGDTEMLQDLVVAAVNEAMERSKEMAAAKMQSVASGLGLPPGLL